MLVAIAVTVLAALDMVLNPTGCHSIASGAVGGLVVALTALAESIHNGVKKD